MLKISLVKFMFVWFITTDRSLTGHRPSQFYFTKHEKFTFDWICPKILKKIFSKIFVLVIRLKVLSAIMTGAVWLSEGYRPAWLQSGTRSQASNRSELFLSSGFQSLPQQFSIYSSHLISYFQAFQVKLFHILCIKFESSYCCT